MIKFDELVKVEEATLDANKIFKDMEGAFRFLESRKNYDSFKSGVQALKKDINKLKKLLKDK